MQHAPARVGGQKTPSGPGPVNFTAGECSHYVGGGQARGIAAAGRALGLRLTTWLKSPSQKRYAGVTIGRPTGSVETQHPILNLHDQRGA